MNVQTLLVTLFHKKKEERKKDFVVAADISVFLKPDTALELCCWCKLKATFCHSVWKRKVQCLHRPVWPRRKAGNKLDLLVFRYKPNPSVRGESLWHAYLFLYWSILSCWMFHCCFDVLTSVNEKQALKFIFGIFETVGEISFDPVLNLWVCLTNKEMNSF